MDSEELKILSYKCMIDSNTKTSARVGSALLYLVLRVGDVIDWMFPLKAVNGEKSN